MLIIRLIKTGKKNSPAFRVVLTQKTAGPKSGSFLEVLGSYNSRLKEVSLKKDRIEYWLSQGVQVSDTVHNLLVKEGIIKKKKIKIKLKSKKKAEKKEKEEKPEKAKEETEEKKEGAEGEKPAEEAKEEPTAEEPKEEEKKEKNSGEPEEKSTS